MTFTDREGRKWCLALTVGTVRRVQSLTGINLGALDQKMFDSLATDWAKLVDVICAVVRPQLEEHGLSDEDFAESLGGDELHEATEALLAALVDFSHPKRRPALRKAIERMHELEDQILARATARLESLSLSDLKNSGELSGSVPESSDATQEDGRLRVYSPHQTPDSVASGTALPG
jgi:hypothetical protein